ncbi:MAG: family transporter [Microbacteriaceae bacterium]|nr:family transporter [Microbacteriaceae bacterium]
MTIHPVVPAVPAAAAPRLSTKVILAIVFTVLAWASAFVVIRGVAPHFSGGSLALLRLAVGTVVLGLITLGRGWKKPTAREWALIVAFGIAWFGAYNVALNIAEHSLDAGTTAMLVGVGPLLIALGAGVFLGEGVPRWVVIGAGVAFVGVVLIGIGMGIGGFGDGFGLFWALLAAVTYAIGVLCQKPAIRRLPAGQVTFFGCAIGMLACTPFLGGLLHDVAAAPVGSILGAVYLGVVPTALAFSTWGYALSRMPASQLGITTYIVPALAIVLGLIVFGEVPAPLAIIGGVVCLAGVALSRMHPRTRAVTQPAESLQE